MRLNKLKNIVLTLLSISLLTPIFSFADEPNTTIIYGVSQKFNHIQKTNELLEITDKDNAFKHFVTVEDTKKYLGTPISNKNLYSSVKAEKIDPNTISVEIKNPENIKNLTREHYINAALTAGIRGYKFTIAPPVEDTGESALIGMFIAAEHNGTYLDTNRTALAYQELDMVSNIVNEGNFNSDESIKLDNVISTIKAELFNYKDINGYEANEDIVSSIVNKALDRNNLKITGNIASYLNDFARRYQASTAIETDSIEDILYTNGDFFLNEYDSINSKIDVKQTFINIFNWGKHFSKEVYYRIQGLF